MSRVVWEFQGQDGHARLLRVLVTRYVNDLSVLLPRCDSDDPLAALAAELRDEANQADCVAGQLDYERFFPLALPDVCDAMEFRRRAVVGQARNRLVVARKVLIQLGEADSALIPVRASDIDAWVQVLSAIRAQWHVDLVGKSDRLAEPTLDQLEERPELAAVLDWLAMLIEDALQAKWSVQPPEAS